MKISDPGLSRSGHQVTQSDLISEKFEAHHSYTEWPVTLKLSAVDVHISIYEMYVSEFGIGDLSLGQFCNLSIIIQWENNKGVCFGWKPFEMLSNIGLQEDLTLWLEYCDQWPLVMSRPVTLSHVAKVIAGHWRSPAVFRQELLIETS